MTLETALAALTAPRPLPGEASRASMIPEYRRGPSPDPDPSGWREASVLILLYPADGQALFPLIQRTAGTGVHAGQVSLPGGARENGESSWECALRETSEELGFDTEDIRRVRELSLLHIPPSRFLVHPFVGVLEARPRFHPAPAEVEEWFETSLDELCSPAFREEEFMEREGRLWRIPFFRLAGRRVWGATAMILAELGAVVSGQWSVDSKP